MILRNSNYTGLYNADYLVRSGFTVFGKVANKYVALQIPAGITENDLREVIVEETTKIPLYKQAMQMQMGMPVRTQRVDRKRYRFYQIEPKNINKYRYEIMEASFV